MTLIQVEYASLDDGTLTLNDLNTRLRQLLLDLNSAMAPVLASWQGAAVDAYADRKMEWDRATDELSLLVADFGKSVDEANQTHRATEERILNYLT